MISNQILQSTIEGLKNITRLDFFVYDAEGKLLVSTADALDVGRADIQEFALSQADSQTIRGIQFFKVYDEHQLEYILLTDGAGDENLMVGKMAAFQLRGLLTAYKERFDRDNFIKNLLLDNLLLVDIYNRAKKLHIVPDARRVVYILETVRDTDHQGSIEIIKNVVSNKSGDFINGGNETFKDITLTNTYVVTAGYYSAPVRYMSLRRFKREDILSSATLKDFVNVYNGPISNALYCPDDNILLSTYHDDTVLTACFWNYPIVQNTVSGIIYAWHDLTNITLPSSMTKIIRSSDPSNLSDCDIRELITDYTSQYAFLLHKNNHKYIVDELHTYITSSGSMLICYDTINNYTSIDFHNIYKYILNGYEIADPTKVLFSWVTPNSNLSCLTRDFTNFQHFPII